MASGSISTLAHWHWNRAVIASSGWAFGSTVALTQALGVGTGTREVELAAVSVTQENIRRERNSRDDG